jgi:hypothetical protein
VRGAHQSLLVGDMVRAQHLLFPTDPVSVDS